MHSVVFDQPYTFVPPYRGRLWPWILQRMARRRLAKDYGVESFEYSGLEHLRGSLAAGHGIIIAPNHCRPADPMVISEMCRQVGARPYTMASWHLFMASRLQTFILRRVGAFSVYREGMDRQALQAAVGILDEGQRPLVLFPEGVITRTNDRILAMMDGLSFIGRTAAKKRAARQQQVVVHPVALRYRFHGDVSESLNEALDDIENRLSWRPKRDGSLVDRIYRVGKALLWLKEIEYFGSPQTGEIGERVQRLIDGILVPMEQEWLGGHAGVKDRTVVGRVKQLRIAILREMIDGDLSEEEQSRRWGQLADMYLAQQLGHYPPDYIQSSPTDERMLETVEKFEEDLTDQCRVYRPMSVTVQVGEPIVVAEKRVRGQSEDPLMSQLERELHRMLGITPAAPPEPASPAHADAEAAPESAGSSLE
jgi:1-acyl-sn-glycerol-3-phosphate acyltransferase